MQLDDHRRRPHDRYKDEMLHRQGWIVLRIGADDLHDPWAFLIRLRAAIGVRTAGPVIARSAVPTVPDPGR